MARDIKITAEKREASGSAEARRMRNQGWLPAVLYGEGSEASLLRLNAHDFEQMLLHHASENLMVDLSIDSAEPRKVLLRDVQHDAVTGHPLHADFVAVSMTKAIHAMITVHLRGEAPGVEQGGMLDQSLHEIEVECLPGDLEEAVEVDISGLNMGDALLVGELTLNPKWTLLTEPDVPVASVLVPRAEAAAEEAEEAEEGEAPAEPELIGGRKDEEE